MNDHATASVRRSGSTNIDLHIHEGSWPICQNGDNSALCGLGMLLGSLGEVHAGCAKPIATTKSWERAPARLKTGCESNVTCLIIYFISKSSGIIGSVIASKALPREVQKARLVASRLERAAAERNKECADAESALEEQ